MLRRRKGGAKNIHGLYVALGRPEEEEQIWSQKRVSRDRQAEVGGVLEGATISFMDENIELQMSVQ